MTSAVLNSAEKQLLQYWLADSAPGYSQVVLNSQQQRQQVPLQASDYAAIGALDNDVVRGYLSSYQVQKLALLANVLTQATVRLNTMEAQLSAVQAANTAISAITVQTVPTTAA